MTIKPKKMNLPEIGERELDLLKRLTEASGVSGNEDAVRKIVLEEIKDLVDEVTVDGMGNVLAVKKGKATDAIKVMIAAHMDEVGLMIVNDDKDGIFSFDVVGGIDPQQLPGKPVWVGKDRIPGMIGAKPIHLTSASERQNPISIDSLKVDVSPANAGKVAAGNWAVFASELKDIGDTLLGKAFDDRVGVATIIQLLKYAPDTITLQAAFTVQEEVGLRGAGVAATAFQPDAAFALDCTPAMDMPMWGGGENTLYRTKLGKGPGIYVADGRTLSDPRLVKLLEESAEAYGIPYQLRQPGGGGTDAGAIHLREGGIPVVSFSVPVRYPHTAAGIINKNDWQGQVQIMLCALNHLNNSLLESER